VIVVYVLKYSGYIIYSNGWVLKILSIYKTKSISGVPGETGR
jgi:hypothetical protein